jgi:hypothetical protein
MLGLANSPNTSCNVDDAIPAAVSAASALVGDRVVYPIGSSLCPCCGSKKGCSTGTCSAADGGDCNPVPAADVTPHTSVLGPWNAAGNCSLNVTPRCGGGVRRLVDCPREVVLGLRRLLCGFCERWVGWDGWVGGRPGAWRYRLFAISEAFR